VYLLFSPCFVYFETKKEFRFVSMEEERVAEERERERERESRVNG
jgi:hypothetical protein